MSESRSATAESDDWVDVGYAASQLGFSDVTILRLIQDGDMPAMQVAGPKRLAHKLPRALVEEARRAVFAGAQVELREFGRQWAARNAAAAVA